MCFPIYRSLSFVLSFTRLLYTKWNVCLLMHSLFVWCAIGYAVWIFIHYYVIKKNQLISINIKKPFLVIVPICVAKKCWKYFTFYSSALIIIMHGSQLPVSKIHCSVHGIFFHNVIINCTSACQPFTQSAGSVPFIYYCLPIQHFYHKSDFSLISYSSIYNYTWLRFYYLLNIAQTNKSLYNFVWIK